MGCSEVREVQKDDKSMDLVSLLHQQDICRHEAYLHQVTKILGLWVIRT